MVGLGKGVEQEGVHIVAHAEGEQAQVVRCVEWAKLSRICWLSTTPSVGSPSVRKIR